MFNALLLVGTDGIPDGVVDHPLVSFFEEYSNIILPIFFIGILGGIAIGLLISFFYHCIKDIINSKHEHNKKSE